ncbi:cation:proton antiporter [Alkalicaulis satelles]|uniref:Cation:proton antiporter n=2 Tax=Alkalicaulis satelles TaxID=2609175 RepID=A0A5M6ZMD2_9PROT|nr:cation:proton antiporter [Alkalicaulis satelles]
MWALLSGYGLKQPLLSLAIFSIVVTVFMTIRMGLLDGEAIPYWRLRYLAYWGWLGREIVKSNIAVLKIVLSPVIDIKPVVTRTPVSLKDDVARATLANSYTLTPGTVTMEIEEGGFILHGLDESFCGQEGFRIFERKVKSATGEGSE